MEIEDLSLAQEVFVIGMDARENISTQDGQNRPTVFQPQPSTAYPAKQNSVSPAHQGSNMPPPPADSFGCCSCFVSVIGVLLHMFDVGTDIWSGVEYFQQGDVHWGRWTLGLVGTSLILSCLCCLGSYCCDQEDDDDESCRCCCKGLGSLIGLGPIIKSAEQLWYGYQLSNATDQSSRVEQHKKLLRLEKYTTHLRLISAITEDAPQLMLQLYILLRTQGSLSGLQGFRLVVTLMTSWMSLTFTMTSVTLREKQGQQREDDSEPLEVTTCQKAMLFICRLAETGGHVLAYSALFALSFEAGFGVFFTLAGLLVLWGCCCELKLPEDSLIFKALFTQVYMYSFVNIDNKHHHKTFAAYTVHYVLVASLWFYYYTTVSGIYYDVCTVIIATCLSVHGLVIFSCTCCCCDKAFRLIL